MKLKWYSITLVAVISSYIGWNFGNAVQRVNVYDQLGVDEKQALLQYEKLHAINKDTLKFVVKDSIIRKESWWLGYRFALLTQRKKLTL